MQEHTSLMKFNLLCNGDPLFLTGRPDWITNKFQLLGLVLCLDQTHLIVPHRSHSSITWVGQWARATFKNRRTWRMPGHVGEADFVLGNNRRIFNVVLLVRHDCKQCHWVRLTRQRIETEIYSILRPPLRLIIFNLQPIHRSEAPIYFQFSFSSAIAVTYIKDKQCIF